MGITAAVLKVKLGADIGDAQKGIKTVNTDMEKSGQTARNYAANFSKVLPGSLKLTESALKSATNVSASLGSKMAQVGRSDIKTFETALTNTSRAAESFGSRAGSAFTSVASKAASMGERVGRDLVTVMSALALGAKAAGQDLGSLIGKVASLAAGLLHLGGGPASTAASGLGRIATSLKGVDVGAVGAALAITKIGSEAAKVASGGFRVMYSSASSLMDLLGRFYLAGQGLRSLGTTVAGLAGALTKDNASFEQVSMGMTTMLGSAQKAGAFLKDLQKFAIDTPFELQGLEKSSQQLLAFGFQAQDVIPLLTSVGNAVSGLGAGQDGLNRVIHAMGEIKAQGRITQDQIIEFTSLGIPAIDMMAQAFGVSTMQMRGMISQGMIPADKALKALTDGMNKRFPDMMKQQSTTFNGLLSNLHDWAQQTLMVVSKPLFEPLKKGLQKFYDYVNSPAGDAAVQKLTQQIQHLVDRAVPMLTKLAQNVRPVLGVLMEVASFVERAVSPIIRKLMDHFNASNMREMVNFVRSNVLPTLQRLWEQLFPIAQGFFRIAQALNPLRPLFAFIQGFFQGGLSQAILNFKEVFKQWGETVIGQGVSAAAGLAHLAEILVSWAVSVAPKVLAELLKLGKAFIDWIEPMIPPLLAKLGSIAVALFEWVVKVAPVVFEKLLTWGEAFVTWALPIAVKLINKLHDIYLKILDWITANAPAILQTLGTWAAAFINWILPVIASNLEKLGGLLLVIINFIGSKAPAILNQLLTWAIAFIDWILPVAAKIVVELVKLVSIIGDWIAQHAPRILSQLLTWATAFISWVAPVVPVLLNALEGLIVSILGWLAGNAPRILSTLLYWGEQLVNWVFPHIPALLQALDRLILAILNWVTANGPALATQLLHWGIALVSWVLPYVPGLINALANLLGAALGWIAANGPTLLSYLLRWGIQLVNWVAPHIPALLIELWKVINAIGGWIIANAPILLNQLAVWALQLSAWVGPQIPILISELGKMLEAVVNWIGQQGPAVLAAIGTLLSQIASNLTGSLQNIGQQIPQVLSSVGRFIVSDLLPKLASLVVFILTEVVPKIASFIGFIVDHVLPVVAQIGTVIVEQVIPRLAAFASSIWDEMAPKIKPFVEYIANNVLPKLLELGQYVIEHIIPGLAGFAKEVFEDLVPQIGKLWQAIEQNLLPHLKDLYDIVFKNIIPSLVDFATKNKDVLPILADVAIAIAAITGAMKLYNIISGVVTAAMGFYTAATEIATGATGALDTALVILTSPITLIIAAIGLLVAAWVTNFGGIQDTTKELVFLIGYYFGQIKDWLVNTLVLAWTFLGNIVKGVFDGIGNGLGWLANNVIGPVFNFIIGAINTIVGVFQWMGSVIKGVWDGIGNGISAVGGIIKGVILGAINFVIDRLNDVIGVINGVIRSAQSAPVIGGALGWLPQIGFIGHVPMYANGTDNHPGGPAVAGEKGLELLMLAGGKSMLVNQATLFPNMPKGSQVIPLGSNANSSNYRAATPTSGGLSAAGGRQASSGGNTYVVERLVLELPNVNNPLNPQQMRQVAQVVKDSLADEGATAKLRSSWRQK